MSSSSSLRFIGIALVLHALLIVACGNGEPDEFESAVDFGLQRVSAAKWAIEIQKKIHLKTLSLLENAPPAQSKAETLQFLQRVQNTCKNLKRDDPAPPGHCPYFYDSFTCWKPVPIGNWSTKTCPKYILGMHTPGVNISIFCKGVPNTDDPSSPPNATWDYLSTNETHFLQLYGMCFEVVQKSQTPNANYVLHMKLAEILRKTQMVGPICYSISFVALAIASLIFLTFRALHCPRNFIHLHLFFAFMIRAVMCLLQYYLFNNGQSMAVDGEVQEENGLTKFVQAGPHWECKLVITLWNYSLVASYFWLLVEGLYLHNVVYFFVFRETGIAGYAIFGWVAPLLVLVPWIAVKVLVEDHLCWVAYLNLNYFWILRGPIMATIIINFFLFINMIRELFLKLKDSHITETRRYRKLARSSVLLVVILGVYYFIISIPMLLLDTDQLTWPLLVCLSIEHIFGSLQGLMVAIVYCFMNSEVRTVIRKRWYRWILLREVTTGAFFSSNPTGMNGTQTRSGNSAPSVPATFLLSQLISNEMDDDDDCADDSPFPIRRSILPVFRQASTGSNSKSAKRPSQESASKLSGHSCVMGGEQCANCRWTNSIRKGINQIRFADEDGTAPGTARTNVSEARDSICSGRSVVLSPPPPRDKNDTNGATRNSIRSRILHQSRKIDNGDTIALLRMRSPHSFDIQEFIKSTHGDDEAEMAARHHQTGMAGQLWLMKGKHGLIEKDRRYSLNNTSVVSYLPLSNFQTKTTQTNTTTATAPTTTSRGVSPLAKGCWQRQSTDAYL